MSTDQLVRIASSHGPEKHAKTRSQFSGRDGPRKRSHDLSSTNLTSLSKKKGNSSTALHQLDVTLGFTALPPKKRSVSSRGKQKAVRSDEDVDEAANDSWVSEGSAASTPQHSSPPSVNFAPDSAASKLSGTTPRPLQQSLHPSSSSLVERAARTPKPPLLIPFDDSERIEIAAPVGEDSQFDPQKLPAQHASISRTPSMRSISSARRRTSLAPLTPKLQRSTTALDPKLDVDTLGWGSHVMLDSPTSETAETSKTATAGHDRSMSLVSVGSSATLSQLGMRSDLTRRLREVGASGQGFQGDRRRATSGRLTPSHVSDQGKTGYFDSIRALARQSSTNLAGLVAGHYKETNTPPDADGNSPSRNSDGPVTIYSTLKRISPSALGTGSAERLSHKGWKRSPPVVAKFVSPTDKTRTHFDDSPSTRMSQKHSAYGSIGTPELDSLSGQTSYIHQPTLSATAVKQEDFSEAESLANLRSRPSEDDLKRREIQNWAYAIMFEAQRVAKVHEHARVWHDPVRDSFRRLQERRKIRGGQYRELSG